MQTKNKPAPRKALRFLADVEIRDNGVDAKTAPVSLLARSGDAIEHWYWGRVVHDMAGMQLSKQRIPIDYCHNEEDVIGFLNKFDTASGDLITSGALVPYSPDPEDKATEVIFKNRAGIPYEASINFAGDGIIVEEFPPGTSVAVNGRTFAGPISVIRQWPLRGVAICPYGQDCNTELEMSAKGDTVNVMVRSTATEPGAHMSQNTTAEAVTKAVETEIKPVAEAAPAAVEATKTATEEAAAAVVDPVTPPAEAAALSAKPAVVEAGKPHDRYVKAFGDKGAAWFLADKPFEECTAEFVAAQNEAHGRVLAAKDAEITSLRAELAKHPGGNPGVAFSAVPSPDDKPKPKADPKLAQKIGDNLAAFAASFTLPGAKTS